MAREFSSMPVPCGNAADAGTAHDPSNGQFTSGSGGSSSGSEKSESKKAPSDVPKGYHSVIGPAGKPVTLKQVEGTVPVIVKKGKTVRGTTYFEDTLLNLSDNFAQHLEKEGDVSIAKMAER